MKIVFLLQYSSGVLKGGAEIQTDHIIREVLRLAHGHEVFLVSELARNESGPRIEGVHYVFLRSHGGQYAFLNAGPLVRILKAIDPDLIYQRWRSPYTGIAAWYARRHGKALVHELAGFGDALKKRPPLNSAFLPFWISEQLGRYGLRHARAVVCGLRDQQDSLRRLFGLESLLIPKGHPVPQGPFPKPVTPVVSWVANIKRLKQPEIFLDLARALEGSPAEFVIAGRPDAGPYQKRIERLARRSSNVRCTGELSQDETQKLMASSSILVNTSLTEGLPNTFVEAWMRETPVVSLNVDPDNILRDQGIGFRSGTFRQLVEDTRFLLDHEAERAAMGRKARAYSLERHDIRLIGRSYLKLFEDLAGPRADASSLETVAPA